MCRVYSVVFINWNEHENEQKKEKNYYLLARTKIGTEIFLNKNEIETRNTLCKTV